MQHFTDPPCPPCEHQGTGTIAPGTNPDHVASGAGRAYDDPPIDCACQCHAAWRMVNQRPAVAAEVAA
jgi:hypothetical protein